MYVASGSGETKERSNVSGPITKITAMEDNSFEAEPSAYAINGPEKLMFSTVRLHNSFLAILITQYNL